MVVLLLTVLGRTSTTTPNIPSVPLGRTHTWAIQDLEYDILSKINVSCAFWKLEVDPGDFNLLVLKLRHQSYLYISVPMGMNSESALCQHTNDIICNIMASKNMRLFNYIDDILCIHRCHNAKAKFDTLYSFFEFLGIPINPKG